MIKLYNIEDQLIVELLKKNPDESIIDAILQRTDFNYKYFYEMLSQHLIEAEVLSVLIKYIIPEHEKNHVSQKLKNSINMMLKSNLMMKLEMQSIVNKLKSNNIETVLMKGLSLDFTGLRVCRDLDILVRQGDLIQSIDILEDINYINVSNELNQLLSKKEKEDIRLQFRWNNQYQLFNDNKNILLELHTNLFERDKAYYDNIGRMLDRIDDIWNRKVFSEKLGVHVFSNEDLLLLMCMHVAIKRNLSSNTFVLRSLFDVERLIRNGIDWSNFLAVSQQLNVSHYLYHSLILSKELFSSDIPEYVFDRLEELSGKIELMLAKYHFKCFKNLKYNSPFNSYIYKIRAAINFNNHNRTLKTIDVILDPVLPSRSRVAEMYGVPAHSPLMIACYIINPFRVIIIFFRNLFFRH